MATQAELNQQAINRVKRQIKLELQGFDDGTVTSINGNNWSITAKQWVQGNHIGSTTAYGTVNYDLVVEGTRVVGANISFYVDRVEYRRTGVSVWGNEGNARYRAVIQGQEAFNVTYDPINGGNRDWSIRRTIRRPGTMLIGATINTPFTNFGELYDTWKTDPTAAKIAFRLTIPNPSDANVEQAPTTGRLTLEYRSRKDNRKLAGDKSVDVLLNTDYVDTARDIPQYTPVNRDIRVRVTGNQTYTVWYNPVPWNVKIEYRLRDGNRLITDKTVQVPLDGTYTETAGDRDFGFQGKIYPENPNVSIRPTGNMTYVVYYKQYPFLTTKYLEKGTNKEIKTQGYKQLTIKSGNYTETAPDIAKYRLVGSRTNNVAINTNSTSYTTTFYYELIPTKADVTVRYLDRATGKPLLQERVLKDQTIGQEITQPARPVTNYDVEQGTLRHRVVEGTNIITFYYRQVAKIRPWAIRKSGAWKSLNTQKQFMKIRRTTNQNYWDTKSNAEIFPSEVNKDNFSASRIRKSGVWKSQGRIGN